MHKSVLFGIFLIFTYGCSVNEPPGPELEGLKNNYNLNEAIVFKLINKSPSKICYRISAVYEKDGKWIEGDPADIEKPNQISKTSGSYLLDAGKTKNIEWLSIGPYGLHVKGKQKLVVYYIFDLNNKNPKKLFSKEFEIK